MQPLRLSGQPPPQVQTFNRPLIKAEFMKKTEGPRTFEPCQTPDLPTEEELPIQDGRLKKQDKQLKKLVASPKVDLPNIGTWAKVHSVLIQPYVMHVVRWVTTRSIASFQAKGKIRVKTRVRRVMK